MVGNRLPLLHIPAPALGPAPGVAVPVRGMDVGAEGRRSLTSGRRLRWRRGDGGCLGLGRRQGTKGGLAIEGQGKEAVCLRLAPGGEDKVGLGRPPP
jgi:hypothetical protein